MHKIPFCATQYMSTSISLTVISISFTRWAAASGQISLNGMILPAALYFWQLPHFMALAYLCRKDYADGGYEVKLYFIFSI